MSIRRGTKPSPNSFCKRSASACLRTEPNTRNPFATSTFVVPQPIPVETPVTTTSLLFAIAFLLRCRPWFLRWVHLHPSSRRPELYRALQDPCSASVAPAQVLDGLAPFGAERSTR